MHLILKDTRIIRQKIVINSLLEFVFYNIRNILLSNLVLRLSLITLLKTFVLRYNLIYKFLLFSFSFNIIIIVSLSVIL